MSIKITRRTGFFGVALRANIYLDEEKVDKIADGETKKIELPNERATLKVTQLGAKSNRLEVKDGQKIDFTMKGWAKVINLLPALIIFIFTAIDSLLYGLLLLVAVFLLDQFLESYQLKIVPEIPPRE